VDSVVLIYNNLKMGFLARNQNVDLTNMSQKMLIVRNVTHLQYFSKARMFVAILNVENTKSLLKLEDVICVQTTLFLLVTG
jgi:hypothetical protein